jgi:hypothetical protein
MQADRAELVVVQAMLLRRCRDVDVVNLMAKHIGWLKTLWCIIVAIGIRHAQVVARVVPPLAAPPSGCQSISCQQFVAGLYACAF